MGVSKNNGTPKSSILIGGFPLFSPSILGEKSPYFWKHLDRNQWVSFASFIAPMGPATVPNLVGPTTGAPNRFLISSHQLGRRYPMNTEYLWMPRDTYKYIYIHMYRYPDTLQDTT